MASSTFLPTNAKPVRYDITLKPDLEKFVFDGEETIEVEIAEPSDFIELHSAEIKIHTVTLNDVATSDVQFDTKEERVTFKFGQQFQPGKATLRITFQGELNDKLAGFYRSKYKDANGNEKYMATTQFEATDARKAFPCWDEPAQKAIFSVTLIAPRDRAIISNMPEVSREDTSDKDKVRVKFADTPIMSTYLLAFIIGEFEYLEGKSDNGVLVRVYTPIGKLEQGRFPLEIALQTLNYYEKVFRINFPLPKLDLLAIPDFAAGAMENWGAITYREARLLIDLVKTSTAAKLANMKTINHEIAHMWFGNLVTMKWWDNLWLNEGFARYMEQIPVQHFYPEYDIWTQFVAGAWCTALDLDGLKTSHPIEVPVKHSSEINEIFDSISYAKGASIIRMLADFVGDEAFFNGLHNYLSKYKYSNAVTEQLWDAIGEASGNPVHRIMDTWTKQMGYPVLSIEEVGSQRSENGKTLQDIKVTQRRFLSSGEVGPEDEQKWIVPITIRTSVERKNFILEEESVVVTVAVGEDNWIKVNDRHVGFYRVKYSGSLLDRLSAVVKSKVLTPSDRLGLVSDLSALTSSGEISTVQFLNFLSNFSEEDDYSVIATIVSALSSINLLLDQEEFYPHFQKFIRNILKPTATRLGWDPKPGEPQLYSLLRGLVFGFLANAADEELVNQAKEKFQQYMGDKNSLGADIQFPVFNYVARNGNAETFDTLLSLFKASDFSEEQRNLLRAMPRIPDEEVIKRALALALSNDVRSQDVMFLVGNAGLNPKGRQICWDWLQNNWAFIEKFSTGQNFLIAAIISGCTGYFKTLEKADEVERFFEAHPVPTAARTIKQSIEGIRASAKWLNRDRDTLRQWFK